MFPTSAHPNSSKSTAKQQVIPFPVHVGVSHASHVVQGAAEAVLNRGYKWSARGTRQRNRKRRWNRKESARGKGLSKQPALTLKEHQVHEGQKPRCASEDTERSPEVIFSFKMVKNGTGITVTCSARGDPKNL